MKLSESQLREIENILQKEILAEEARLKGESTNADKDKRAFFSAVAFHEAGLRCLENKQYTKEQITSPLLPTVVNFAFAIELYIKSRLLKNKTNFKTHSLIKLYMLLDTDFRSCLTNIFTNVSGLEEKNIEIYLSKYSDAFTDWRYVHESSNMIGISILSLIQISTALYNCIVDFNKEWIANDGLHERLSNLDYKLPIFAALLNNGVAVRIVADVGSKTR